MRDDEDEPDVEPDEDPDAGPASSPEEVEGKDQAEG